jgi:hypothetical protein
VGGDRFALARPYAVISDRTMDKDNRPALPLFLIGKLGAINARLIYLRPFRASQCTSGKSKKRMIMVVAMERCMAPFR